MTKRQLELIGCYLGLAAFVFFVWYGIIRFIMDVT